MTDPGTLSVSSGGLVHPALMVSAADGIGSRSAGFSAAPARDISDGFGARSGYSA